jgi:hypothetical protein
LPKEIQHKKMLVNTQHKALQDSLNYEQLSNRDWWHLFREKLKDSVASDYYSNGAENPNPEQMYYYMTYIQYFRRWRNKMNKFTIPLAHMLKWADDSRTKSNEEEEQQIEKEMSLGKLVDEAMKTPKFRIVYGEGAGGLIEGKLTF